MGTCTSSSIVRPLVSVPYVATPELPVAMAAELAGESGGELAEATEDEGEEVHNLRVVFWFAAIACAVAAVVGIVATRILREENARIGYQMTIV